MGSDVSLSAVPVAVSVPLHQTRRGRVFVLALKSVTSCNCCLSSGGRSSEERSSLRRYHGFGSAKTGTPSHFVAFWSPHNQQVVGVCFLG